MFVFLLFNSIANWFALFQPIQKKINKYIYAGSEKDQDWTNILEESNRIASGN